jgi:hypothetical protein
MVTEALGRMWISGACRALNPYLLGWPARNGLNPESWTEPLLLGTSATMSRDSDANRPDGRNLENAWSRVKLDRRGGFETHAG